MRVRNKSTGVIGNSNMFHEHDLNRIIVATEFWIDDDDVSNYDVYFEGKGWIDLEEAFRLRLVIPDNYTNYFRASMSDIERERGYYE